MWPDLLKGLMSNLSTYGLSTAPSSTGGYAQPPVDPIDSTTPELPPMNPNPSFDEMIQIAQRYGGQPKGFQQPTPDAPPQTPADATAVARPQGKGTQQQTMLNMLMQHLLSANGAPPYMSDVAQSHRGWQDIYKYYHPTLTPGQPLPLRMR